MIICPTTNRNCFKSAAAAWKTLQTQGRRKSSGKQNKKPQSVFKCADCGQWHLTRKNKTRPSPRRIEATIAALRT